ncbi:MAG: hypothetical protein ACYTHM_16935, partial [Planctomycetota bacterium]
EGEVEEEPVLVVLRSSRDRGAPPGRSRSPRGIPPTSREREAYRRTHAPFVGSGVRGPSYFVLFFIIGGVAGVAAVRYFFLEGIQILGWKLFWEGLFRGDIMEPEFVLKSETFAKCVLGFLAGGLVFGIGNLILRATVFAQSRAVSPRARPEPAAVRGRPGSARIRRFETPQPSRVGVILFGLLFGGICLALGGFFGTILLKEKDRELSLEETAADPFDTGFFDGLPERSALSDAEYFRTHRAKIRETASVFLREWQGIQEALGKRGSKEMELVVPSTIVADFRTNVFAAQRKWHLKVFTLFSMVHKIGTDDDGYPCLFLSQGLEAAFPAGRELLMWTRAGDRVVVFGRIDKYYELTGRIHMTCSDLKTVE